MVSYYEYDEDDFPEDALSVEPEDELEEPRWTVRRVVLLLLALVMIAALVAYLILPLLDPATNGIPGTPTPPPPPPSLA